MNHKWTVQHNSWYNINAIPTLIVHEKFVHEIVRGAWVPLINLYIGYLVE